MPALTDVDSPQRGVVLLDNNLRITFANRRACEIFGGSVRDLIGQPLPDAITRRSAEEDEIIEEVLESWSGPQAVLHRYSTPIISSDGATAGRVEIYSDITARRELEEEILDSNKELARLNTQLAKAQDQLVQSERLRALGEMAAGVAHDINNVLGIILGNVQLARRKLGPGSAAARSIDAIELAAKDAAETVRRLREIGKPAATSRYEVVDLSEVAQDVVAAAVPAWKESADQDAADITVETDLKQGCTVLGNATELREALANILLNAAQAVDSSGAIQVRTSRDSEHAHLTVCDTGVGMSEETRKRVFDPFFTTRGAQGTGLGMSMVDAIAIRHGAKVVVDSEQGKGTTVTLRIPLHQTAE